MADRRPVRYLAPVALASLALGVYLIVHHNLAAPTKSNPPAASGTHRAPPSTARSRVYVVKPGDILGTIAARNGLTLAEIEALNPALDPNSLRAGQRLRLRR